VNTKIERLRRKMHREEQPENPEFLSKARVRWLLDHYGICSDQYIQMWKSQDGRCAICDEPLIHPHLDHNHETNEVRQLLCGNCNAGLGMFKESVERMLRAIGYIQRWNG
jgi:hypothetical protein